MRKHYTGFIRSSFSIESFGSFRTSYSCKLHNSSILKFYFEHAQGVAWSQIESTQKKEKLKDGQLNI